MSRMAVGYTVATILIGLVVALIGMAAVDGAADRGVAIGSIVGALTQVLIFWSLFVFALPEKKLLAHTIGILIRFFVVVVMALLGVGALGVPAAPTLFALVAVLFGASVSEAFFIKEKDPVDSGALSALRTHS